MARKKSPSPKVQRGISLTPELYAAIQADAEKLGLTFNEVAERVLVRAFFPDDQKLHAMTQIRHRNQEEEEVVALP